MRDTAPAAGRRRLRERWLAVQWYVVGGLVAVTVMLGVAGFSEWFVLHGVRDATLLDALYKSLQLFTLESGSADPPVPLTLEIARFLAGAVTVLGAVVAGLAIFGERLARWRIARTSGHAVVCGLGERGLHIARGLAGSGRVAVIERDDHNPFADQARDAGAVIFFGDATDSSVLRRAGAHNAGLVVMVCAEDGENAEIAVRLRELVAACDIDGGSVRAVAHIDDTELCELLREQVCGADEDRRLEIAFLNVAEKGAEAMLAAVEPPAAGADEVPHVVVVGLGKLGRSLVLRIARDHWRPGPLMAKRPRITLIDSSAEAKAQLLRVRFPALDRVCELDVRQMGKNDAEFERGEFLYEDGEVSVDAVYICPDDDVHALVGALAILRHTRGHGVPIAVRMRTSAGLASLIGGTPGEAFADLRPVGVLDAACDPEELREGG